MSTGSTGSIFPKWKLAILLGAPLALGLTYLYYRRQSTLYGDESDDGKAKKKLANLKVSFALLHTGRKQIDQCVTTFLP